MQLRLWAVLRNISNQLFPKGKKRVKRALLQVRSLKRTSELQFRFKGNKAQFVFNEELLEKVEQGKAFLEKGKTEFATTSLDEVVSELKKRNKKSDWLIRVMQVSKRY